MRDDAPHLFLRLADADAADRIARQVEVCQRRDRLLAQALEHAALYDAEQRVRVGELLELGLRADGPAQAHAHGARHGLDAGDATFDLVGGALVELHRDVAVEHVLDLHADFGREQQLVAVDRRGEGDAFLADLGVGTERPDLEAAAVGKDRPRPGLETVQAAEMTQHVEPGPHPEVEGVAQDDLRTHGLERLRHHALDGAVGADGHEDRRLDRAATQGEPAAAREAIGV